MIREKCSCGAEIETDEENPLKILRAWRKNHVCKANGELIYSSGFATVESAPDYTKPEMHLGFRYNEDDDEA